MKYDRAITANDQRKYSMLNRKDDVTDRVPSPSLRRDNWGRLPWVSLLMHSIEYGRCGLSQAAGRSSQTLIPLAQWAREEYAICR